MNPVAWDLLLLRLARTRPSAPVLAALVSILTTSTLACGPPGAGGTAGSGGAAGGGDAGGGGDSGSAAAGGGVAGGGGAAGDGDAGSDTSDASIDVAPAVTLKSVAAESGRFFGAALGATHLADPVYAAVAAAELNYATPENEMKWDATEPTRGTFTFARGDAVVAFAEQHGMLVKGHTLVWHSQLPSWVSEITDATDLRNAMIQHVTQVVSHFRGKVVAWDVVNEAWVDGGQSLRATVFTQYLGAGFIDEAFNAAHAADPNALLYYNDYGTEGMSAKANAVYSMVQGMLARGVPIHGVGLQMHTGATNASPTVADLATNMQRLAALGLDVVISEMDVQICNGDLDAQSRRFHDIVAGCVAQPACKAVTVWGVPDKYSWRNGQSCPTPRPLLFDDDYLPKPAYAGVLDAFMGR